MRIARVTTALPLWVALIASVSTRTFGLPERVPNTTLRMPASPPANGYALANAFGDLAFTDPTAIVSAPGETNRLFVTEQAGRVAVITNLAAPIRTVFLDITSRVVGGTPTDERGLLGLAFHPGYATNRFFFVFYSTISTTPGIATDALHERLSRFQAKADDPDQADAGSEVVLINQHDQEANHNGGDLHFGPDGYLYVSVGDEGGAGDTYQNSQRIDKNFFSGILRLDVDKRAGNPEPNPHPSVITTASGLAGYSVPADNPFVGATRFNGLPVDPAKVRTEFWAVGLRNPWRFCFDPATGFLYCGDVGEDNWEELDIIVKGGNYGWNYREGLHEFPPGSSRTTPPDFAPLPPILEYAHGIGANQGDSITGGVVYRGNRLPELAGAYVFGDYVSGNIWMLRYDGANTVPVGSLSARSGISAFGIDPASGDVLLADQNGDTVKRLVSGTGGSSDATLPPTLADTGAFRDLASLTPNPGIVPYDINVPFWSDNARKRRWFSVPDTNLKIDFDPARNWSSPAGTVWIKHFDLELTNGVAASARRLETRFLVRNSSGIYGVTYRWDSASNATLVPEEGLDETFTITEGETVRTQVWHYPSRAQCLLCHTTAAGLALGFNTPQMNRDVDYGSGPENQIAALNRAGYFSAPVAHVNTLRALASPTDAAVSVDYRVRSYLAANCAQCHQPGAVAQGNWDARVTTPLSQAGIINGTLSNNRGDPANRVIEPGSVAHSMILTRIATAGSGRMPPLDSSVTDAGGVSLLTEWITGVLLGYRSFADWQTAQFGDSNLPDAAPDADPDHDGANNLVEYLTGTDPKTDRDVWQPHIKQSGNSVEISFPQIANRGFQVESADGLESPFSWQPLDVPGNRPAFPATSSTATLADVITNGPFRFYRVRIFEP